MQGELDRLQSTFKAVGIPLHEVQIGQCFKALGWVWDSSAMTMSVTEDKLLVMRAKL